MNKLFLYSPLVPQLSEHLHECCRLLLIGASLPPVVASMTGHFKKMKYENMTRPLLQVFMDSNKIATFAPHVVIDPNCTKSQRVIELQILLQTAANELGRLNAWKAELGEIQIIIFRPGFGVGFEVDSGIWTLIPHDPNAKSTDLVVRDKTLSIQILVDESFFHDGLGSQLVKRKEPAETVALWCLAHEIFHLDEYERMSEVGIVMENRFSAFAGAVRPEFSPPWREAWRALCSRYKSNDDMPADLRIASDIANEASADMTAIRLIKDSGRNWRGFLVSLADLRKDGLNSWIKESNAILARFKSKRAPPYKIDEEIRSFIANDEDNLPDLKNIYARCWTLALTKALELGSLDHSLRSTLRRAENSPPLEVSTHLPSLSIGPPSASP